mmetsp:Transcript_8524/g.18676  ORF Transcript_8524/g.18676 Transcript_8524/m.18676 type:complete len:219 (-) Transcript_8524:703-1359(-)
MELRGASQLVASGSHEFRVRHSCLAKVTNCTQAVRLLVQPHLFRRLDNVGPNNVAVAIVIQSEEQILVLLHFLLRQPIDNQLEGGALQRWALRREVVSQSRQVGGTQLGIKRKFGPLDPGVVHTLHSGPPGTDIPLAHLPNKVYRILGNGTPHVRRALGPVIRAKCQGLLLNCQIGGVIIIPVERRVPTQHNEHNYTTTPDIHLNPVTALEDLRGHVV